MLDIAIHRPTGEKEFSLIRNAISVDIPIRVEIGRVALADDDAIVERQDDPRQEQVIHEDTVPVHPAVAVGVFVQRDTTGPVELAGRVHILHVSPELGDVHPAVAVKDHVDGLRDNRVADDQFQIIPFAKLDGLEFRSRRKNRHRFTPCDLSARHRQAAGIGLQIAQRELNAVEDMLQDLSIEEHLLVVAETAVENAALAVILDPDDGIIEILPAAPVGLVNLDGYQYPLLAAVVVPEPVNLVAGSKVRTRPTLDDGVPGILHNQRPCAAAAPGTAVDLPPYQLRVLHPFLAARIRCGVQTAPAAAVADIVQQRAALGIRREGSLHCGRIVKKNHVELLQVFEREVLLVVIEYGGVGTGLRAEKIQHQVDYGDAFVHVVARLGIHEHLPASLRVGKALDPLQRAQNTQFVFGSVSFGPERQRSRRQQGKNLTYGHGESLRIYLLRFCWTSALSRRASVSSISPSGPRQALGKCALGFSAEPKT